MRFGPFDTSTKVVVVAEIGNNHEGDFTLAQEMIGRAAEAGVDAVKFQTFIPEQYISKDDISRLKRLREFQLSYSQFEHLAKQAADAGVVFFSTPFDIESAHFLNTIQSLFKISSGDNTFFPLIETVAGFGKPMIISTGLADVGLLMRLKRVVDDVWQRNDVTAELAFLHCVSSYPTPPEQANLGAIATLKDAFPDCVIGYSDHTLGIEAAGYAVAAGARIVEKHFTLDKNYSDFRDHQLSSDPVEMRLLVETIGRVSAIMGNGAKVPQSCEEKLRIAVRRSIGAARDISVGAVITINDITWLRPGTGTPAGEEGTVIGRRASREIKAGEIIQAADLTDA